jgi:hypothetical protein
MKSVSPVGRFAAAAVVLLSTAVAASAEPVHVTPGNWEVTVVTEGPNMPGRPMTMTHCIKPEDVSDSQTFAQRIQQRSHGKCTFSQVTQSSDKMSFSFTCEGGSSGSTEVTFVAGSSYEATTKVSVAAEGNRPAMNLVSHIKAHRTGDC